MPIHELCYQQVDNRYRSLITMCKIDSSIASKGCGAGSNRLGTVSSYLLSSCPICFITLLNIITIPLLDSNSPDSAPLQSTPLLRCVGIPLHLLIIGEAKAELKNTTSDAANCFRHLLMLYPGKYIERVCVCEGGGGGGVCLSVRDQCTYLWAHLLQLLHISFSITPLSCHHSVIIP